MGLTNNRKMKLRKLSNAKKSTKPSKLSPAQIVKKDFGSKKELAAKVMPLIERKSDETEEEFKSRIETLSNKKLLKLLRVGTEMAEGFDSKDALAEAVYTRLSKEGSKTDNDYLNKLKSFSMGRLLDMNKYYRRNK